MLENYEKQSLKMIFSSLRIEKVSGVIDLLTEIIEQEKTKDLQEQKIINLLKSTNKKIKSIQMN